MTGIEKPHPLGRKAYTVPKEIWQKLNVWQPGKKLIHYMKRTLLIRVVHATSINKVKKTIFFLWKHSGAVWGDNTL
jgi:hypothetical protein